MFDTTTLIVNPVSKIGNFDTKGINGICFLNTHNVFFIDYEITGKKF